MTLIDLMQLYVIARSQHNIVATTMLRETIFALMREEQPGEHRHTYIKGAL